MEPVISPVFREFEGVVVRRFSDVTPGPVGRRRNRDGDDDGGGDDDVASNPITAFEKRRASSWLAAS